MELTIPYGLNNVGKVKETLFFLMPVSKVNFYSWARSESWLGWYLDCSESKPKFNK
jgi:hypothetical protein